ncbi:MAG: peptidase M50 [Mycobacterium sp.]|nr:peptidase M50 [Mycobacterium sp.]
MAAPDAPPGPRADLVILAFGGRRIPRSLSAHPVQPVGQNTDSTAIDDATATARRIVVLGTRADLAAVLTRLLRTDRLGVEVAHIGRWRGAARAQSAAAQRVPLIRDETGQVIVDTAFWLPADDQPTIEGEAIVDDTLLFDGRATAVRIEPLPGPPGLRASVLSARMRPARWVSGRAAQLGTTGARVVRDGQPAARPVRRSTFYRHTEGWLRVG